MISTAAEIIFWGSVFLVVYSYLGYPIVLLVVNKVLSRRRSSGKDSELLDMNPDRNPRVTMLVAAYNEEKVLQAKMNNSLQISYPPERLQILIGSDGSSDRTNEIGWQFNGVGSIQFFAFDRGGKAATLNKLADHATGEILVFSDANTMYRTDALQKLVAPFSAIDVGAVCGRLHLVEPGTGGGTGEGFYWRYESWLKRLESALGVVMGANGGIYAIRRTLFSGLPRNIINDDFYISVQALLHGQRLVYADGAVAEEEASHSLTAEFRRHVRDGAGHYQLMPLVRGLLTPRMGLTSFAYFSHRWLRWVSPFLLVLALLGNTVLAAKQGPLYGILLALQVSWYLASIVGYLLSRKGSDIGIVRIPTFFSMTNLALLVGCFKRVTTRQDGKWEKVR